MGVGVAVGAGVGVGVGTDVGAGTSVAVGATVGIGVAVGSGSDPEQAAANRNAGKAKVENRAAKLMKIPRAPLVNIGGSQDNICGVERPRRWAELQRETPRRAAPRLQPRQRGPAARAGTPPIDPAGQAKFFSPRELLRERLKVPEATRSNPNATVR